MNKRLVLIGWISLLFPTVYAQEIVFERRINLVTHGAVKDKITDVIPVITNENLNALIFLEREGISIVEINEGFQEKSFYVNDRPVKYQPEETLGYSVKDGIYYLFNSNSLRTKFHIHRVSPEKQINDTQPAPIALEKERILETISSNGLFYLLTVVKNSSELRVYEFSGPELKRKHVFDFSNRDFPDGHNHKDLYRALLDLDGLKQSLVIEKIDLRDPVSLEQAAKQSKFYIDENHLYLTFDYAIGSTTVLEIDLKDFSYATAIFDHAYSTCPRSQRFQTNSFVYDHELYQMQLCKSDLSFQIIDIESGNEMAAFTSKKGANDWIIGSVLQDGDEEFASSIDLSLRPAKTALKTISRSEAAIVARINSDQDLIVQAGSHFNNSNLTYNEIVHHTTIGVGPNGSIPMHTTFSTYNNYKKYEESKANYFEALLNRNSYEPVDGEVLENLFDRIRYFKAYEYVDEDKNLGTLLNIDLLGQEEESLPDLKNETIFRLGDQYYFGYFVEGKSSFVLHSFGN